MLMEDIKPEIMSEAIGEAEIQYLLYPGDGPPLVLLHATGFLPWLWHPIARALSSRFRIIAPYFCDHREVEPEEGGLSWVVLAEDLSRLCERLSLEKPFFAGHSMGATIIAIAHALLGMPAEKMVFIEPIVLPEAIYEKKLTAEQHPLAAKSIKRRNSWTNMQEAKDYLRTKTMFAHWDDEMLDLYVRYGMISSDRGGLELTCHPRREASLFLGGMHFDPWPILPKIKSPVLVVEGESSENQSFIDLPRIASLIPNGSYHLVKGAGHMVPQEKPVEIIGIISDFWGD
jgi:lipase